MTTKPIHTPNQKKHAYRESPDILSEMHTAFHYKEKPASLEKRVYLQKAW